MKKFLFVIAAVILVFSPACKKDPVSYELELISGENQIGEVEKVLPQTIQVRLFDQNNKALSGVLIEFTILSGGGILSATGDITNTEGVAEVTWTLGPEVGEQKLQAKADDGKIVSNSIEMVAKALCKNTITYSGEEYPVVTIGNQCWFAKNLNIGTLEISPVNVKNDNVIQKTSSNLAESGCDTYGGLYFWKEAMKYNYSNKRGICPDGWHIPSNDDWEILVDNLGGGDVAGGKLKSNSTLWQSPNVGDLNESGFGALPAGGGGYLTFGIYTISNVTSQTKFWSSTKGQNNGYVLALNYDDSRATMSEAEYNSNENLAIPVYSCRCLKDD